MMQPEPSLVDRVRRVVAGTPIFDIHTHLYDPGFGSLLLRGIDELLVYHYLVSEVFRHARMPYDQFWSASRKEQADLIWQGLFMERSPISEACRGVLTTLHHHGLDPRSSDLPKLRAYFEGLAPETHVEQVLSRAGVQEVHMTNSPFDEEESRYWNNAAPRDARFVAALRIDPLLLDWPNAALRLRSWGYDVTTARSSSTADEVRRFLRDWTRKINSRYCMVSLPPEFACPDSSDTTWLLDQAVLPHGRDLNQPLALMLGVKRAVNPGLRLAGDGVGRSDLSALQHLCVANPQNRFLATCLSRENQHELAVLARKFPNLHPFGCWWFTNTPSLMAEITTLRLELLGTSFTAQHSDARVLDQLIYKWDHTREVLANSLSRQYDQIQAKGWTVTDEEIRRDAAELLGGAFRRFCRS